MVQGKCSGSSNTAELDSTNSCGTCFSLRYPCIARFASVPNVPNNNSTSSCSTSCRANSSDFCVSQPLSKLMSVIFRPCDCAVLFRRSGVTRGVANLDLCRAHARLCGLLHCRSFSRVRPKQEQSDGQYPNERVHYFCLSSARKTGAIAVFPAAHAITSPRARPVFYERFLLAPIDKAHTPRLLCLCSYISRRVRTKRRT